MGIKSPRHRFRAFSIRVLTRHIARSKTSKTHSKVMWTYRQALLRMRALLLSFEIQTESPRWSATRRLVMLRDPVSDGLWPFLRRRKGLNLPQRLARWLVMRANPSAREALTSEDLLRVNRLLRSLRQKSVEQILAESRERFMPRSQQKQPQTSHLLSV